MRQAASVPENRNVVLMKQIPFFIWHNGIYLGSAILRGIYGGFNGCIKPKRYEDAKKIEQEIELKQNQLELSQQRLDHERKTLEETVKEKVAEERKKQMKTWITDFNEKFKEKRKEKDKLKENCEQLELKQKN